MPCTGAQLVGNAVFTDTTKYAGEWQEGTCANGTSGSPAPIRVCNQTGNVWEVVCDNCVAMVTTCPNTTVTDGYTFSSGYGVAGTVQHDGVNVSGGRSARYCSDTLVWRLGCAAASSVRAVVADAAAAPATVSSEDEPQAPVLQTPPVAAAAAKPPATMLLAARLRARCQRGGLGWLVLLLLLMIFIFLVICGAHHHHHHHLQQQLYP